LGLPVHFGGNFRKRDSRRLCFRGPIGSLHHRVPWNFWRPL
jgi:hypothetical protein